MDRLEDLLAALNAARDGDFGVRLSTRRRGIIGELAAPSTSWSSARRCMTKELARIGRVIGREGRMTERASLGAGERRLGAEARVDQRR